MSEKKIDIKWYIVSINIKWNVVFVKTNKSIINSELVLLNDKIIKNARKKILKIYSDFQDFDIKYII